MRIFIHTCFHHTIAIVAVLAGLLLFEVRGAEAQSPPQDRLVIPKIEEAIDLDGRPDEPAWEEARSLPLVQMIPDYGDAPSEETEILIGYTDEHLYVACRCYDRGTPSAPSYKRDYSDRDSDFVGIRLDTFNDNENALAFFTTPTGLRMDVAVLNDAVGDLPLDFDWNTFWDAAAHENDEGWFAEMRIPIATLGFDSSADEVVMGLIAGRLIARKNEELVFPAIPPEWGVWSSWKPSQAQKVVFENLHAQRLLRVTPYVLGGGGQQNILNDSGTAYERETEPTYDAGLDIKYGLAGNLTLDLTINTDFAQVEADDQEVNLTRFPLFFPEKRRFFQERSSNFAFDFGGPNRLFYSRQIGLHEGQQVRILGGARLVGRTGPWDIGLLNMQTARESGLGPDGGALPSENFGVARLRRRVLNPYSYVGGILTSRIGTDGAYNVAYGLDSIFRVTGDEYLTARWAQTFYDRAPNRLASLAPARLLLEWERRSYRGFNYSLGYSRSGERYHPGLGFTVRENYFRLGDRVGYGWIPGGESLLERHRLSLAGGVIYRNSDHSVESLEIGPEWEFETNSGHSLTIGATRQIEDLREPFRLSDEVLVPEGRHTFDEGQISYGMPPGRMLRTRVALTAGSFYDGRRGSIQVSPTWNVSRHVRLDGDYEFNRVVFPDRDETFTSHIGRIRLEVTPSVKYSLQAFVQYNSAGDVVVGNIRFRYNPREGNDLYLVLNEALNTDRSDLQPRPPLSMGRTVLLKYTYTLDM